MALPQGLGNVTDERTDTLSFSFHLLACACVCVCYSFPFLPSSLRGCRYDDRNYEWLDLSKEQNFRWLHRPGEFKPPVDKIPLELLISCGEGATALFHVHTRQVELTKESPLFRAAAMVAATPEEAATGAGAGAGGEEPGEQAGEADPAPALTPSAAEDLDLTEIASMVTSMVDLAVEADGQPGAVQAQEQAQEQVPLPEVNAGAAEPPPVHAEAAASAAAAAEPAPEQPEQPEEEREMITLDEFQLRAQRNHEERRFVRAKVLMANGSESEFTVKQWLTLMGIEIHGASKAKRRLDKILGAHKEEERAAAAAKKLKAKKARAEKRAAAAAAKGGKKKKAAAAPLAVVPLLQQVQRCASEERSKVTFGKSVIHGWGLFAKVPIKEGQTVAEYRGDIVRHSVANEREQRYRRQKKDLYLFAANPQQVIDGTDVGSIGRFMNHSCAPSCFIKQVEDKEAGIPHLAFFARTDILAGQELTFDYRLREEDDENKWECKCGAPTCRGTMN